MKRLIFYVYIALRTRTPYMLGMKAMTPLNSDDIRSPRHRIEVLKKTRQHTDEKIFALEAELAHREGYIGVDETKSYFASIRAKDD